MNNEKALIKICEVGKKLVSDYLKIVDVPLIDGSLILFDAWLDNNIEALRKR